MDPRWQDPTEVVVDELLAHRATSSGDRVFLVFEDGDEWTYARTANEAWKVANGLRGLGVGEGDHVSCWLPNGKDAARVFFGTLAAGAIYSPLNTSLRGAVLEHTLNLARSSLLLAHGALVDRLGGLDLTTVRQLVVFGDQRAAVASGITTHAPMVLDGDARRPCLEIARQPWDDMCLMPTSGTTGPSKGVRQSYSFYRTWTDTMFAPLNETDRFFSFLPMFHNAGVCVLYGTLRRGGSAFVTQAFDRQSFWSQARRFRVTTACLVGGMATTLLKARPDPDDARHQMREVILAPLVEDLSAFRDRFGVRIRSGYGMTEIGQPFVTGLDPIDHRSCGRLVPGYAARIVDTDDWEVPAGEPGELIVRHEHPWSLCSGYEGMPEATAALLRNAWYHTGDAFRRDDDGNYYFLDRLRDVIRRHGENMSTMEIEREISGHPGVQQCAVFGVPGVGDEEVMAVIVPTDTLRSPLELIEFLMDRLPHFMIPRYIDVADALPTTQTDRVQKSELRARGVTPTTWDREGEGVLVRRPRLDT